MLLTRAQMQATEERAFAAGISAADLMETAGAGIAQAVSRHFPHPGTLVLYLGSGHNAGDALVAARYLKERGWHLLARLAVPLEKFKPLPRQHWQALGSLGVLSATPDDTLLTTRPVVCLDGLLGIGSQGPLRPDYRALAEEMNGLRHSQGARTVAMDLPSGLNADTGEPEEGCVVADITATVAYAKSGLLQPVAINHVGRLALVPLPDLADFAPPASEADSAQLLTAPDLRRHLPHRPFDFHKGRAGRLGILAGSPGFYGAAELACRAALRAGAGLVTLLAKAETARVLALRVPPEIMVKAVADYREVLDMRFDALGIGPGLGLDDGEAVLEVIEKATVPAVIDADALTILAKKPEALRLASVPRLLTPHPGEMKRLRPDLDHLPPRQQAETWARENAPHSMLLKGARTVIATQGGPVFFNTTGHPGMATGGMGDVLTGVAAALLAQGHACHNSAGLAAWLCGRAAELHTLLQAEESTLPSDVIEHLGRAWYELKSAAG